MYRHKQSMHIGMEGFIAMLTVFSDSRGSEAPVSNVFPDSKRNGVFGSREIHPQRPCS